MADSLYNIFGDHLLQQSIKNTLQQPLNNENIGKPITGPTKSFDPKKGEVKKSFLSNTGQALQSTPDVKTFAPRTVNMGALIYSDPDGDETGIDIEEFEFTKPTGKYDNFHWDFQDYLPLPLPDIASELPCPITPPLAFAHSMFDDSNNDDFFSDDFSNECIQDDLGLPDLY